MGQQTSSESANNPSGSNDNNPEVAWWCKLLSKIVGVFAGLIAACMGIWTCVTVHALCIIAGLLQIALALLLLLFEAPVCCQFMEITKPIATFAERRTYLQKGVLYCGCAIIPVAMCFGVSTLVGCGLIFATGVIYGLMGLGKKADRETMMANAQPTTRDDKYNLVDNDQLAEP